MTQDAIKDFLLKTLHYTRFELEYARADSDAWLGHVAFGYMLVSEFRPNLLVELGTHWGNSYFSFCQAVRDQQLNTKCFAVDSWEGDPQAGFYDNAIFDTVSKQNAQYESFSTLKRMFFDDAVSSFDDESIDILHIDGFHSYEAVKHDFTAWIGKVRPGGIVLFHDTNEYQEGFGVNRFWDELCEQSTEYHLFRHSHGLGVWRKPGGGSLESTLLGYLLTPASPVSNIIDALFTVISERAFFRKKYLLEQKKAVTDRELAQQALRLLPFDRLRKNGYGVHRHLRMYKNILKKKESAVLRHSMKLKLLPFDSLKKNKNAAQPYVTSLNKNLMKNRISLYTSFRKRRVLSVKFLVCSALLPGE